MYSEITTNKRNSVLLMIIFIAVLIGLGYVFSMAQGDHTYAGVWIALIISLGMTSISYFQGDKIALAVSGARPITAEENKYVYRLVENLCITAGQSVPKIYIIEDPAINAFATGRKPELASIALTTGAITKLTNEELEGVIAHELSHIKNYDIRFMMLVAVLVGAVSILSNIFLHSRMFGGGRSRDNDNGGNQLGVILMIVGIILAILSPLIAELIKLAISRRREYLADASGALLTRYPEGLAKALEKIATDGAQMRAASSATAHLFIANPFGSGKKFASLFSTHPPIEERVKRLRTMGT
jgi:heat shock protein HtpX